jgi:hypothetical protein
MEAEVKKPRIIIEAVVKRADETVENLGEICNNAEVLQKIEEVQNNG